jgi:hypothetical protein
MDKFVGIRVFFCVLFHGQHPNEFHITVLKMSTQPSSPDRRLYTKLRTVEQTVSWTIDNFPLFVRTTENAEALTSAKFEIPVPGKDGNIAKTRWSIDCYPKGRQGSIFWSKTDIYSPPPRN